ncbi:uncharacterized protein LOC106052478 isoform X2 [Biomphalaria glabrata]|uniref:Uncharacterized protein LOC106052478 isoform X2 n=1 Tax=Biomphalaria glabrata TaxID=6526 RepID=A0A9W2ZBP9_BIOGL|nr:uncharacterized protein LOC106052478 isoform X2 [Biomphalaria glabrata]
MNYEDRICPFCTHSKPHSKMLKACILMLTYLSMVKVFDVYCILGHGSNPFQFSLADIISNISTQDFDFGNLSIPENGLKDNLNFTNIMSSSRNESEADTIW